MTVRRSLLIAGALLGLGIGGAAAQEETSDSLEVGFDEASGTIAWQDQESETGYRVSGHVLYTALPACEQPGPSTGNELVDFSEELPANTTSFELPAAQDPQRTFRAELQVTVEALTEDGSVLAQGGFNFIAETFCPATPTAVETAIPAETPAPRLPETGASSLDGDALRPAVIASVVLGALGALLVAGSFVARRRG
ncbi:MAG: hypothetical protein U1B78_03715 [Dehalococcoidia bacterium]|nr:hypothetical protein [Dehalococcoidia bacterium]